MKKTFKLLAIFMGILIVGIVGAVSGYLLISKNKTFHIYDLRFVEPVEGARGYVYMDTTYPYTLMKNKKVYMTAEDENYFDIAVYANVSSDSGTLVISSSNPDVAKITYQDGKCYVNYLMAGEAVITTEYGGVSDSFKVKVFDQIAEEFSVYDYKYYGDYASYFPNKIIGYSDGITYAYDYKAFSASGKDAGDVLNNDLLRIDTSKLNTSVFENVYIDSANKQLVVKCKSGLTSNIDEQIVIQSYYYSASGESKVANNYVVNVHIVAYTPEFLQIVLATTPDFEDGFVFMNTSIIDDSDLTEENIIADPDILDDYLSYKKAENYLANQNEKAVYQTLFTDKVSKIYLKFRKVYTNGDIVYLDPTNEEKNPFELTMDENYCVLQPTKDFYKLTLTEDYFISDDTVFNIGLKLSDYDLKHTFKFEFAKLIKENLFKFYDFDEETGVYTYSYWDVRTHYNDEITNKDGQIVGIAGF